MTLFSDFEKNWLRPFLFFGNNPISLIGGAITSASALTLIGFWVVAIFGHGGSSNGWTLPNGLVASTTRCAATSSEPG